MGSMRKNHFPDHADERIQVPLRPLAEMPAAVCLRFVDRRTEAPAGPNEINHSPDREVKTRGSDKNQRYTCGSDQFVHFR